MSGGDTTAPNPYTPRSEIQEPDLLAGRDNSLDEITHKLSQAANNQPRYHNIAISGEPGIGKTSLCNSLDSLSTELGLTSIQLSVESDQANNPAKLFKRIHRRLVRETRFGKIRTRGKALTRRLKQVMVNIPGVPIQFSLSAGPGIEERSKNKFGKTLSKVSDPVVLILDNAQAFLDSPSTLAKIYNVFSNLDGVLLVLAANTDLYEETTEELSHVWRKFDFYSITSYSSLSQTKDALQIPLNHDDGIKIPEETVQTVHDIAEGRPAEINLLGYYMYDEAKKSGRQELRLTPAVLSQTLSQLEHRQSSIDTSKVDQIKELSEECLRDLVAAIEAPAMSKEGLVNYCILRQFTEIRPTEYEARKEEKRDHISNLLKRELLSEDNTSNLKFTGGSYDQIFAKLSLYTRDSFDMPRRKAVLTKNDLIPHIHYELIDSTILNDISDCHSHFKPDASPTSPLYSLANEKTTASEELYTKPSRVSIVPEGYVIDYEQRSANKNGGSGEDYGRDQTCIFAVSLGWCDERFIVVIHAETDSVLDEIEKELDYVESRVSEIGVSIEWETEFSYYHEGVDLKQEGKCGKALEKFQEAVDLNPKFSPAWYQQGLIHQNHGDYEEAESVIDKALAHRSDWIDALIARGRVLWEQEKTDEFIRTVESVCTLLPDDSILLYECALRLEMDDPHKAAEFAERAYDTDKSLVEALVCSLACSYEDERYEDTIEYYERIKDRKDELESRQKRIVDLYYIGALVGQERFGEAFDEVTSFPDSLRTDPCAINYAAGVYLMKQEKWSEAEEYIFSAYNAREERMTEDKVEMSYKMCSQARENRTWVDLVFDERENRAYSSILPSIDDRSPLDRHIFMKRGEALFHLEMYDRALEEYRSAFTGRPSKEEKIEATVGEAKILAAKNEWDEALDVLQENKKLLEESVPALYLTCVARSNVDGTSSSTLELQQAIEIDADRVKELCRSDLFPDLWMEPERQIQYVEIQSQKMA